MASIIAICNEALDLLPADRIQSLDAGTLEAKSCSTQYGLAKRNVLARRSWTFLRTRTPLAPIVMPETVRMSWLYAYALPDNVRIDAVGPSAITRTLENDRWRGGVPYELMGDIILSNQADAVLIGRIRPEDCPETRIDDITATAIAYDLAQRVCMPIIKSVQRYNMLLSEAAMAFAAASRHDQEQTPNLYGDFIPEALGARHA
jgi:hypothetical protein